MSLGDEYGLAPVATESGEAAQEAYLEGVDTAAGRAMAAEVESLMEQYERWPTVPTYEATLENQYRNARDHLRTDAAYSADALAAFIRHAALERNPTAIKPGLFVSAAVAEVDADGPVTVPDLSGVDYCLAWNEADVTVEGGVGDKACYGMEGGTVTVKGDAGTHCGRFMEDGMITVNGDTGTALGHAMTGGRIHVHGDADDHPGLRKQGGLIAVEGDMGCLPHQYGGVPAEE